LNLLTRHKHGVPRSLPGFSPISGRRFARPGASRSSSPSSKDGRLPRSF
jgi:hypothetical protein